MMANNLGNIKKDRLWVTVRSRQGLAFEGELAAVSSINPAGPFDVLPEHTNFVCMVANKLILRKMDGKVEEINLDKGVLTVDKNRVDVFIGVGTL